MGQPARQFNYKSKHECIIAHIQKQYCHSVHKICINTTKGNMGFYKIQ